MIKTIIIALILFLFDAFVLTNGVIGALSLFLLPVSVIINPPDKQKLKENCVYLVMSIMIFLSIFINNSVARNRAEYLITACENFKKRYNAYPDNLSDLVPEFIDAVPVAKYTLYFNKFIYKAYHHSKKFPDKADSAHVSDKTIHSLMYTSLAPFGRPFYVFEEKKWKYLD